MADASVATQPGPFSIGKPRAISATISRFNSSISVREADRSGAEAGAVAGSSFQPAKRLYWMASVALIWSVNTAVA